MEHFNRLTPAEDERLALLIEECAAVIQAATKIQRHGYDSGHPRGMFTNRQDLERELGHLRHAVVRMEVEGDIRDRLVDRSATEKARTIGPFLHHQGDKRGS